MKTIALTAVRKLKDKLITMEENTIQRPSKKFLGGLTNFESKMQRNFQKAHLNAYLQGRQFFKWGWVKDDTTGQVERGFHLVHMDLTPVALENPEGRSAKRFIKKYQLV